MADADIDIYDEICMMSIENRQPKIKSDDDIANDSKAQIKMLSRINQDLSEKNQQLMSNISSLIKTSRAEINRKNAIIADLRRELENVLHRRVLKQNSSKELKEFAGKLKELFEAEEKRDLIVPEEKNSVKTFAPDEVHIFKIGNTSVSFVCSDINEKRPVTVESSKPQDEDSNSSKEDGELEDDNMETLLEKEKLLKQQLSETNNTRDRRGRSRTSDNSGDRQDRRAATKEDDDRKRRRPDSKDNAKRRNNSTNSNSDDLSSPSGISAILRGDLVPGSNLKASSSSNKDSRPRQTNIDHRSRSRRSPSREFDSRNLRRRGDRDRDRDRDGRSGPSSSSGFPRRSKR